MKSSFIILTGLVVVSGIFFAGCLPQSQLQPEPQVQTQQNSSSSLSHGMQVKDEKDFITQMIPHHQEAIDTSVIVEKATSDADLKKFTTGVVQVQTAEIEQMKNWLQEWYGEEYSLNTSYMPMMGDLTQLKGEELEKAYIQGMIVHHQGAIDMANQVLLLNPRPEVEKMAQDIIAVQQQEVETLQGWLMSKYGVAEVSSQPSAH